MKDILDFILSRLRERSTWLGLISLITALGILMTPEQQEQVVAAGMGIAGLITTLTKDKS